MVYNIFQQRIYHIYSYRIKCNSFLYSYCKYYNILTRKTFSISVFRYAQFIKPNKYKTYIIYRQIGSRLGCKIIRYLMLATNRVSREDLPLINNLKLNFYLI